MRELRWPLALGMAALVGLTATTVASTPAAEGGRLVAVDPPACLERESAARGAPPRGPEELPGEPWYRIAHELSADGVLEARTLILGRVGSATDRSIRLAPESFVSGPFGHTVLLGSDDGRRTSLRLFDADRDCLTDLGESRDIVRQATIDSTGRQLYEHRIDRRTRADLGVFRRPLAGGDDIRVMRPLHGEDPWGRTFSTELSWDLDGEVLAVQACGAVLCRTRTLDPVTNVGSMFDDPGQGELLGLAHDVLVTWVPCSGLPCPILGLDLQSGEKRLLAEAAGHAIVARTQGGAALVHETGEGSLRIVEVSSGAERTLPLPDPTLRLVPRAARSQAGLRLPDGWIALADEPRLMPDQGDSGLLLDVDTGGSQDLAEVAR